MVHGFAVLLIFQLIGEVLAKALALPLPGPLVGMLLLFAALVWSPALAREVAAAAQALLDHLMLLFIPAVTGVMMYFDRMGHEWLPFVAACLLGAAITIAVTAFILRWMLRLTGTSTPLSSGEEGSHD